MRRSWFKGPNSLVTKFVPLTVSLSFGLDESPVFGSLLSQALRVIFQVPVFREGIGEKPLVCVNPDGGPVPELMQCPQDPVFGFLGRIEVLVPESSRLDLAPDPEPVARVETGARRRERGVRSSCSSFRSHAPSPGQNAKSCDEGHLRLDSLYAHVLLPPS